MTYAYLMMPSPVGTLTLMVTAKGLAGVLFACDNATRRRFASATEQNDHPLLCAAKVELQEYFAGQRRQFTLPLDLVGSVFQRTVWQALLTIPYGQTRSYREIAQQIGKPRAMRAVGAANGKNPIAIIVPCHRVIGANGALVGFGGGITAKATLLALERASS